MSLYYGYKKETDTIEGLPLKGGTMTGDIDMQTNYITTSADPTQNSHLARKKYVDDRGGNFLEKTGGNMSGNINMGNHKILTNTDPTDDKELSRKNYVDNKITTVNLDLRRKLNTRGGTMTGNINMRNNKILTTADPTQDTHLSRKKYIDDQDTSLRKNLGLSILKDNFSLKFHNLFFVEYDSAYDLLFERNGGKVKELCDFGIEGNHFTQTTKSLQPSLSTESEKENNKYFLKFNGNRMISNSNINPISGKKDIINVFIVYKLNSLDGEWLSGGLFGNDNGGYDKFITFANSSTREMIVGGVNSSFHWFVIGGNKANHRIPYAAYKTKANAGEINKWMCLSIHWDNYTTPKTNESFIYCNGKQICHFESVTTTGDVKLSLGNIKNDNNGPLNGSIIFFSVLKYQKMTQEEIKFYHYVLCNLYNVDHDPINI